MNVLVTAYMREALMQSLGWGHQKPPGHLATRHTVFHFISVLERGAERWDFLVSDQLVIIKTSFGVLMVMRENNISAVAPESLRSQAVVTGRAVPRDFRHERIINQTPVLCRWGSFSFWDDAEYSSPCVVDNQPPAPTLSPNTNHHHKPVLWAWRTNNQAIFCRAGTISRWKDN